MRHLIGGLLLERRLDPKLASLAKHARNADLTTHQLNQSFAHHQADTGALDDSAFLSETIKWLKELRNFLRRKPGPGIVDMNANDIERLR